MNEREGVVQFTPTSYRQWSSPGLFRVIQNKTLESRGPTAQDKFCATRSMGGVRMCKIEVSQFRKLYDIQLPQIVNNTMVHGTSECHKMVHVGADNSMFAVPSL